MIQCHTLNDWLVYLEHRHDQEIQLGLSRIKVVASRLNLLSFNVPVVTVGGTNGKGSTVRALEIIYYEAGYRVASYTSPHLIQFNDRILVNLQPITNEKLCEAFQLIEQYSKDLPLSHFEVTTLAAFWYFKQFQLDVILLEVGLGGRQDATNIIDANLSIITTVDLDHQAYLGDNKEAIGYEKAGILRQNTPCIYADIKPPSSIVTQAQKLSAPMLCFKKSYDFDVINDSFFITLLDNELIELPKPRINLQAAAAAVIASRVLSHKLPVSHEHIERGMLNVIMEGRQQIIAGKVLKIFDVAHNPQAVQALASLLRQLAPQGKVHAIFSALKDKDLHGLINPMVPLIDFWYPCLLPGKRAVSKSDLLWVFEETIRYQPFCFDTPLCAYRRAMENAKSNDAIIVYGSFLTLSSIINTGDVLHEIVVK